MTDPTANDDAAKPGSGPGTDDAIHKISKPIGIDSIPTTDPGVIRHPVDDAAKADPCDPSEQVEEITKRISARLDTKHRDADAMSEWQALIKQKAACFDFKTAQEKTHCCDRPSFWRIEDAAAAK